MSPAEDSERDGGRTSTTDRRIAYALLRIVFGVNIFFHELSRLLGDHAAFLAYLSQQMQKRRCQNRFCRRSPPDCLGPKLSSACCYFLDYSRASRSWQVRS